MRCASLQSKRRLGATHHATGQQRTRRTAKLGRANDGAPNRRPALLQVPPLRALLLNQPLPTSSALAAAAAAAAPRPQPAPPGARAAKNNAQLATSMTSRPQLGHQFNTATKTAQNVIITKWVRIFPTLSSNVSARSFHCNSLILGQ